VSIQEQVKELREAERKMALVNHTPWLAETGEAFTIHFCLIDDAYELLNPRARRYESLKRLADNSLETSPQGETPYGRQAG
jgi:hypothetical protein